MIPQTFQGCLAQYDLPKNVHNFGVFFKILNAKISTIIRIHLKLSRNGKISSQTKILNLGFVTYMYRGKKKFIIKGGMNEDTTV